MQTFRRCLVVGADGLIGSRLLSEASTIAAHVVGSTRKQGVAQRVFVDLASEDFSAALAVQPDVAFLCAAVTSMEACRSDPVATRRSNVTGTVRLAEALMEQGCFVVFLSSNTVFDGEQAWPDENAAYCPITEYGAQKVAAETALRALPGAAERLAIVRLSKVLGHDRGVVADLLTRLPRGETSRLFADLRQSPVSVPYVCAGLLHIAAQRAGGIHHLAGEEELSYADFGRRLAAWLGADPQLVMATDAASSGVPVLFRPRHPGLAMTATTARLGLKPESLEQMFAALVQPGAMNEH